MQVLKRFMYSVLRSMMYSTGRLRDLLGLVVNLDASLISEIVFLRTETMTKMRGVRVLPCKTPAATSNYSLDPSSVINCADVPV